MGMRLPDRLYSRVGVLSLDGPMDRLYVVKLSTGTEDSFSALFATVTEVFLFFFVGVCKMCCKLS
jgi:hypothetical protein